MKLLLDTHVWLWILADSPRLTRRARDLTTREGNQCFVSAVSFWEVAIKSGLRRRGFGVDVEALLTAARTSRLHLLAFLPEHAVRVASLPTHHADPFDRALIAQALVEPLTLVTHDDALASYGDFVTVV